jgi:hypothetical protein
MHKMSERGTAWPSRRPTSSAETSSSHHTRCFFSLRCYTQVADRLCYTLHILRHKL